MKILQIANFNIGANGVTSVLTQVIRRLVDLGHTVNVFSVDLYAKDKEELVNSLGGTYYYKKKQTILNKHTLLRLIPDLKGYDVVHLHGIFIFDHIMIANILYDLGIPYVVSIHGNLMSNALKHSKIKKKIALEVFIKKVLKRATLVHALAREEYIDIKKIINKDNIRIINNGIEVSNFRKKDSKSTENILKILFVGRVDIHHKGLDLLLEALNKKSVEWKNSIKLYLVGPYNTKKDEDYIKNRINNNYELDKLIFIEGPKYGEEKYKYYDECDLFIHTSRYEGMPMAVLEAMSVGLPCLVTPETNMASLIENSKSGFITNCDVKSIINSIEHIKNISKHSLSIKGENACNWCFRNLTWDKLAREYEVMYHEVTNNE